MFKKNSREDFRALTKSLTLNSSFEAATSLIFGHIQNVQELLNRFIAKESLVTEPLRRALCTLPEENFFRLLTSPYLCELLMIVEESQSPLKVEPVRHQIVQALVAEVRVTNPAFDYPLEPKWTIDGDIVLDETTARTFPAVQTQCGIRLNYQSYVHNTGKPGIGGYTYAMALRHKERLETGKAIICSVSKAAFSLVDTFTTTVQVRLNNNRPNVVNSSTHTSIGLIRSDNFHNLHGDMPEIVDMLVHESIHQYLHLFEEQLFMFVEITPLCSECTHERAFPSPWSGNLLDLRSYTHAVLVWYGLWHFWSNYVISNFSHPEVSEAQVVEKLSEAAFGFLNSHSVLDNLSDARKYLVPDYVEQIEKIQNQILSAQAG